MKCSSCQIQMEPYKGKMQKEDVAFEAYRCPQCGEELMDMQQLGRLANKYRKIKNAKTVTFARWGNSLAVRIPKTTLETLNIKEGDEGILLQEKEGIKIIPA